MLLHNFALLIMIDSNWRIAYKGVPQVSILGPYVDIKQILA